MSKTLGILGGMSWVSTQLYYRLINEGVARRLGKQHSAELLIASVDFQGIVDAQVKNDWQSLGELLGSKAERLAKAGASAFLIASNTMHLVYETVQQRAGVPGLSIFDATAQAAKADGRRKLGLLGTRYTMRDPFFVESYHSRGIEMIVPSAAVATRVNEIIFRELIHGKVKAESVAYYQGAVEELVKNGAEGVILGCTEISLLLDPKTSQTPLYDTTALHAEAAVRWLCE